MGVTFMLSPKYDRMRCLYGDRKTIVLTPTQPMSYSTMSLRAVPTNPNPVVKNLGNFHFWLALLKIGYLQDYET